MNERLIPRPNAFSIESWEALSREEQIRWWKAQPQPERRPFTSATIPRLERMCNWAELMITVFENLTEDNVQEVLAGCPPHIFLALRKESDELPLDSDDDGWNRLLFGKAICYAPWVTDDEIREFELESRRSFRDGVRLFRKHIHGVIT